MVHLAGFRVSPVLADRSSRPHAATPPGQRGGVAAPGIMEVGPVDDLSLLHPAHWPDRPVQSRMPDHLDHPLLIADYS